MSDPGCQLAEEMQGSSCHVRSPRADPLLSKWKCGRPLSTSFSWQAGREGCPASSPGPGRATLRGDPPASHSPRWPTHLPGGSRDPGPLTTTVGGCISSGQDTDCSQLATHIAVYLFKITSGSLLYLLFGTLLFHLSWDLFHSNVC